MSTSVLVPSPEMIHLFAVDAPLAAAKALCADGATLADALGVQSVDVTRAECLQAESLVGVGVDGYLTEGQGASADAVLPDEPMLETLTGPILVLGAGALPRDARSLTVKAPLRHMGSYPLEGAKPAGPSLEAETARPNPAPAATPPEVKAKADRKASGYTALGALLVLAVISAVMVWVAG